MNNIIRKTVIIGALGYFVDIYDLVLFSMVRTASLRSLGIPENQLLDQGVLLINWQMGGMLLGGIFWGMLGDKKGRVSVLFGSIFLYSLANIANAFVTNIPQYAVLRFLSGIGLAGELGAAITLVSEVMPKESRGYGTAFVAAVGLSGAIASGIVCEFFSWKISYISGGVLGLILLFMRASLLESGIYKSIKETEAKRGDLKLLFANRKRVFKYLNCILIGVPLWFVVGVLMTFGPEIAKAAGATGAVLASRAILCNYAGIAIGDLLAGFSSQWLRSRKKVVGICLSFLFVLTAICLYSTNYSPTYYYIISALLGLAGGYWAVFATISAEQFGTNLRATVAISTPNFVRGSVILCTLAFHSLKSTLGISHGGLLIAFVVFILAFIALSQLEETYGKDLQFIEC
jgi:MFS family permease